MATLRSVRDLLVLFAVTLAMVSCGTPVATVLTQQDPSPDQIDAAPQNDDATIPHDAETAPSRPVESMPATASPASVPTAEPTATPTAMQTPVDLPNTPHHGSNHAVTTLRALLSSTPKPFFGQQRAYTSGVIPAGWFLKESDPFGRSDIKSITGRDPGVHGFPVNTILDHESLARDVLTVELIIQKGSIIEFDWHAHHPLTGKYEKFGRGKTQDQSDDGRDLIPTVLPGGAYHSQFRQQVDKIAEFFLLLQDRQIAALFRPFHEMSGTWFWWGSDNNPEDFKALYNWMYQYLKGKGINNLLYVFAPNYRGSATESLYNALYPGDESVDVIGLDYYGPDLEKILTDTLFINEFASSRNKLMALTETGPKIGGFHNLKPGERGKYFSSVANYMQHFEFVYVRTWGGNYIPTSGSDLQDFLDNFCPHVRFGSL